MSRLARIGMGALAIMMVPLLAGCPDNHPGGRPTIPKPTATQHEGPTVPTVQPGTYCNTLGQVGRTKEGHPMQCGRYPGEDKPRWRDADDYK